jgi:hypothetical protein
METQCVPLEAAEHKNIISMHLMIQRLNTGGHWIFQFTYSFQPHYGLSV